MERKSLARRSISYYDLLSLDGHLHACNCWKIEISAVWLDIAYCDAGRDLEDQKRKTKTEYSSK